MKSQLTKSGSLIYRFRLAIVLIWIVLILFCLFRLNYNYQEKVMTESTGASYSEAFKVMEILRDEFKFNLGTTLALVFEGEDLNQNLKHQLEAMAQVQSISKIKSKQVEKLNIYYFNFESHVSFIDGPEVVLKVRDIAEKWRKNKDIETFLTGNLAFYSDILIESKTYLSSAEMIALACAFIILIFSFGGIWASLLPILMGISTLVFVNAIIYFLNLEVTPMSQILCSLLGLALAIDYSLFIVSRFQEEIRKGANCESALKTTFVYAGKTIFVSALIVLMSIIVLLIPEITGTRIMARNVVIVIFVSALNSILILLPILVLTQKVLNWPESLTRMIQGFDSYHYWRMFSTYITKHPVLYFLIAVILLTILILPVTEMKLWDPVQTLASNDSESMLGYDKLREDGWGGQMVPIHVIVRDRAGKPIDSVEGLSYIYDLTSELKKHSGIEDIISLSSWHSYTKAEFISIYQNLKILNGMWPVINGSIPLINSQSGGDMHLISVFSKDVMNVKLCHQIALDIRAYAQSHPEFEVLTGGMIERSHDFTNELYRHTPLMVSIVILSIFILLFLYMKAFILPIKAAIMNFFPILGAFGILCLVYQFGWFSSLLNTPVNGAISSMIPITLFCIIFGLSMDYEVLILSRITEAYEDAGEVREAVIEGMARSGSVISSAALIFLCVFMPAVYSHSPAVKELGIGMVSAIFIDATIVRLLLVPSFMMLMGKWNWWNGMDKTST